MLQESIYFLAFLDLLGFIKWLSFIVNKLKAPAFSLEAITFQGYV